jgi:hypothetical protein
MTSPRDATTMPLLSWAIASGDAASAPSNIKLPKILLLMLISF